jgi:hypothetical protein
MARSRLPLKILLSEYPTSSSQFPVFIEANSVGCRVDLSYSGLRKLARVGFPLRVGKDLLILQVVLGKRENFIGGDPAEGVEQSGRAGPGHPR